MTKHLIICTINGGNESAWAFNTRQEAVSYVESAALKVNLKPEPSENNSGIWDISLKNGNRIHLGLKSYANDKIQYRLHRLRNREIIETRKFSTRNYAVSYVKKELNKAGYDHIESEENELGSWKVTDGGHDDFALSLAIVENGTEHKYYKILGVKQNASQAEIEKAYKAKAKKAHPDMGGSSKKFIELKEAYEEISGKNSRKKYNSIDIVYEYANIHLGYIVRVMSGQVHINSGTQQHTHAAKPTVGRGLGEFGVQVLSFIIFVLVILFINWLIRDTGYMIVPRGR